ncbi:MAG TPA: adenylate/guanylate cyclase domain-containing protein [Acidimicrobiales bacterium]|nr:adenylate/guanylate cyclase domain-containing protein [Acidimicrobiales bacterium]
MERSAELEAVTRRWWAAYPRGDPPSVLALLAESDDLLWVGTDPGEEWWGRDVIDPVMTAQFSEFGGGPPFRVLDVHAWTEGTVGWSYSSVMLDIEPESVPVRFTAVFHLVGVQWRIVHCLTAIPVGNEESLGMSLTTSVDLVAQAVELERPDLGVASASDGSVTLLFTDIEGSTARNAAVGDQDWMLILRAHHDLVRTQVAAHDGFEVKSMGDGFMLAFSSASDGLRCAIDIQRAIEQSVTLDVRVRAGLHTGEAVREGNDFYGGVVNMAARVAGQAQGGEVLASSVVHGLVEASCEFRFHPCRYAELKGISGMHELFPVAL